MRQAVLSTLHTLTCSIPMTILRDKLHSYAHFTDEETKAKRGCSRGCSCSSRVHPPHPACLLRHLPGPFPTNPFHMAPPPPVFPLPEHWEHVFWEAFLGPWGQAESPFLELIFPGAQGMPLPTLTSLRPTRDGRA